MTTTSTTHARTTSHRIDEAAATASSRSAS
ncbi:hypothetical protein W824_09650 [Clavibacter cf. michiganensis LMG 26808]|nr:hypothetical protein W824_09650 [Clavibacter cf. michiganensis LMG 26808]